jgi:hypothetical protein
MSSAFTLALKGTILSLEVMIPVPGSDEGVLQAWGEDFCKILVRSIILNFVNHSNEWSDIENVWKPQGCGPE